MARGVTVIAGPAGCGKTFRLAAAYRQALAAGPLGAALWLTPTFRSAAAVAQQIPCESLSCCFSPNCLTFDQFARRVLDLSELRMRPLGPILQRQTLRHLIDEISRRGELRYFAPIAASSGFLDLVVDFIQELKRLEIWPEELVAACGPRPSAKDRELCDIYRQYQRLLGEHDLYDPQGRFWSARALLREGGQRPFDALRHVFVDGFADFTRTEHEILEILADRVESLSITLPLEETSPRAELFTKSTATLDELRNRHPRMTVEWLSRRSTTWPALAHLEERLFGNPRHATRAAETEGIEIVAAGGVTHEIELIARRVKQLLVRDGADGTPVRPGDILIVFRSLAEAADPVREIFERFGIPVAIGSAQPLGRAPILSALVAWLRLDLDDWPFRQVLAALGHNYLRPKRLQRQWELMVVAAEKLVRHLQVASGRGELTTAVERLARSDRAPSRAQGECGTAAARQAKLAHPLLEFIGQTLDALPKRAALADWADAVTNLAESLGLFEAAKQSAGLVEAEARAAGADPAAAGGSLDLDAWRQLVASLRSSDRLSTEITGRPAVLTRREFFDHLREVLHCAELPEDRDETGRVRVLSAENVRNLSAPHVFVAGLSERAFPPPDREDCLHSEAETRRLVAAGLPLVTHSKRNGYEMLLFYEVVTRATRQLTLSYPALDHRAQPLSPSPYLSEIERACGPGRIRKTLQPELTGVPTSDEALCPRDLRVLGVAQALRGDTGGLVDVFNRPSMRPVAENLAAGLRAASDRRRGTVFGRFEGMLFSAAARGALRARYGPERCWSPSQLEQYARCPHQFFLQRVLHVEPFDEPALEIDYLHRGRLLHWLLSALHRRLKRSWVARGSPVDLTDAQCAREIDDLIGQVLNTFQSRGLQSGGLLELDARRVSASLAGYARQQRQYDAQWRAWDVPPRPAHFEVAFGPARHVDEEDPLDACVDDEDGLSSAEPFELKCGDETVRFSGRIDRIDIGSCAGKTVFNIVDYKSGRASSRTSARSIAEGYSLQLPLYALAAQKLLADEQAIPMRGAYWHVGGGGYKEMIRFHADGAAQLTIDPDWQSLETQLRHRVRSLVEGIRRGEFPMHSADEKCTSYCAYHTVCRVNQVRSLNKSWQPPAETSP